MQVLTGCGHLIQEDVPDQVCAQTLYCLYRVNTGCVLHWLMLIGCLAIL